MAGIVVVVGDVRFDERMVYRENVARGGGGELSGEQSFRHTQNVIGNHARARAHALSMLADNRIDMMLAEHNAPSPRRYCHIDRWPIYQRNILHQCSLISIKKNLHGRINFNWDLIEKL